MNNQSPQKSSASWLRGLLPEVIVVVLFALLSVAYFFPADIEGRVLFRHDASAGRGAGMEINEYYERTGDIPRWTNSLFSGMPTYQMAPSYDSVKPLSTIEKAYHLWLPDYVWYLFAYLLGFYILLRAFNFRNYLAALGSILWAFSTYFIIIIGAGHFWKVIALAYLPPMIGGIVLAYRGKYLWGMVVTAIFAALEVKANHVQMTYYYLLPIALMVLGWLVEAIFSTSRKSSLLHWLKATAAVMVGGLMGILVNLSNLYHTWEYQNESMRGKSELVKKNTKNQTSSGLERDYITAYSYGISETWSLLVPNVKGGTSERSLGDTPQAQKEGSSHWFDLGQGQQLPYSYLFNQMPQYWEEPPGTSGPVYVGAFVLMLFILGLFIVKGPVKWAMLIATVVSILLAWGKNFMPFTDFFIDHVPMYAKFRTVESILVIAEFCIPLLAMLTLKEVIDDRQVLNRKLPFVYVSLALTGGAALLFALMPGMFFSFVTDSEAAQFSQMLPSGQAAPFIDSLVRVRQAIFTADCWRSLIIIAIGTLVLLVYKTGKIRQEWVVAAIAVLCLVDLWQVNKRYVRDDMFVEKIQRDQTQPKTKTDEVILQDKALYYRVLNLASNTFNENETSYYHKSIGGYHAAKLRRYNELIETHISDEMRRALKGMSDAHLDMTAVKGDSLYPVLNMLNTKWFIVPIGEKETLPIENPYALGNAWMVDKVEYVDNANAEIAALGRTDLRHVAVADKKFSDILKDSQADASEGSAVLTAYEPDRLCYDVESKRGGVLVFSEIYYPGWKATVDGKPVELGRVDYVLRAMPVEAGSHKVELSFHPSTVTTTDSVSYATQVALLVIIAGMTLLAMRKRKEEKI